jgi:hypothetical protein
MKTNVDTASELQHQIGATGRLIVHFPSGEATIRGTDSDTVRIQDHTGRPLADRFEIAAGDGSLELMPRQRLGLGFGIAGLSFGSSSAELEIDVPRGASVSVDTASGDVEVRGLFGPKHFRSASGDVTLQAVGGDLDVQTVSGDIEIDAEAGLDLGARSVSGDFHLRAPRLTRFEMNTTSGDVEVDAELAGAGPFSIKSISGDVTLVARSALQVEAQTITGDLSSGVAHRLETSPGRKVLTVGKPTATLAFKSVSGDLEIVEPRDQAAADRTPDFPVATATRGTASGSQDSETVAPEGRPRSGIETDGAEQKRLEILRSLERGEITVDEATAQLAATEEV